MRHFFFWCLSGWLYYTVNQLANKNTRDNLAIQHLKASVDIDASNGQAWYLLGRLVMIIIFFPFVLV